MPLNSDSKLKIISNLEKSGIEEDYESIIDNMESFMNKNTPSEAEPDDDLFFDFDTLKGMSPANIQEYVQDNKDMLGEYGISQEKIDNFITGLNKSNILPYKAYKSGSMEEGEQKWGFYKNIDRYEKGSDRERNPLYFRYYKDGTYDMLDQKTFDSEKNFNQLPDDMKNSTAIPIDESQMTDTQKSEMYNKILDFQSKL